MPFPNEELPIFVDIAPGASPAAPAESWDPYWVDITRDVRVANGIAVTEGIPDEANQADPSEAVITLNNGASKVSSTLGQVGCYSPRNPLGPYFGSLAKNTPLRVRLQRGRDTFSRTTAIGWGVSDSGIAWSNGASANLSVSGNRGVMSPSGVTTATGAGGWDFDLTCQVGVDALPGASGDGVMFVNFRRSGTSNSYRLWLTWAAGGDLNLFLQRVLDGVVTTVANVTADSAIPLIDYRVRLRAQGGFIGAKVWRVGDPEPLAWTAELQDENAYTLDNTDLGANIQFQASKFGTPVTNAFYWSDVTITSYPFIGSVSAWPVRWDKSGNDSWVPLKASGVIRRLQQGKSPLRSPFYSFLEEMGATATWMMEDESGANLAASATPGVAPATFYESDPAGWQGKRFGGTSSQFTVNDLTTISGTLPRMVTDGKWFAWIAFYMPVLPVTNPIIFRIRSAGTVTTWDVRVSDDFGGVIYILGVNPDSTVLITVSAGFTPGQWVVAQVQVEQTGSTFTGRIVAYHTETGVTTAGTSAAATGSVGSPNAWSVYGSTGFQEGAVGPVAFWSFVPPVWVNDLLSAARGFEGETAEARITRLCAQKGVQLDLLSGGRSTLMGVQDSEKFMDLLNECAQTDMGFLTEFRGGLRYRTRGRRYSQNPRMTVDFAAGHVKEPPEPTDDDQRIRNDVTVERKGGGSARMYDLASIEASDLYDTSVTVNTATDDVLMSQAGWRLHLGTWDEVRWPSIILDLARNVGDPTFVERATSLEPGAYIILENPPEELPGGEIRLLVEAISYRFGPFEWTMELTCSPYTPWMVPNVVDPDSLFSRIDLVGSTLASAESTAAVGATDTWTITNTGRDWNTTQVPYFWRVSGEVVEVTAISGTGTQTATVVRGVEGFTKDHEPGETISLAYPLYLGL